MIISITGHTNIERCHLVDDSNTYIYNSYAFEKTFNEIETYLLRYIKENKLIDITLVSGMARGVDEIFALIAIKHNFRLILCVPKNLNWYQYKEIKSGLKIQALSFKEILSYTQIIKVKESKENYDRGNYGYFISRNQDMVDISDVLFSYKGYESGGTNDCIERGIKKGIYKGNIRELL